MGIEMRQRPHLSQKSREILEEIAAGYRDAQIVDRDHGFHSPDIFAAATEELEICDSMEMESETDDEH